MEYGGFHIPPLWRAGIYYEEGGKADMAAPAFSPCSARSLDN